MRPERRPPGAWEQARGPLAFWGLVVLVILGAYLGFRALAPHPAGTPSTEVADSPRKEAPAPAATPAGNGKPLQLPSPLKQAPANLPLRPATGTEPATHGIGLTPAEMAAKIREGCPSLVLLFSTTSAGADELVTRFDKVALAAAGKVTVLAFATDQDPSAVDTFLHVHPVSFDAALLQPATPEQRAAALREAEIKVGRSLDAPAVLLVGANGELLGRDLGAAEAALKKPLSSS